MIDNIMKHFDAITKIPHCSSNTTQMKEMIQNFATSNGFSVKEDSVGNVLCQKGNPKICLQSHYDMVCMGDAPNIEMIVEDGWLKAKNSSLGADNGMGMAIMMSMMETHENLECLFTNDEEIGLIGANNLELQITSKKVLNLDSEEEEGVFIGCAGGVDIFGELSLSFVSTNDVYNCYEVSVDDLPGGHSGVDIDKDIPNAIKVLMSALSEQKKCYIVEVEGGERNNAIAKSARAKILTPNEFTCKDERVKVVKSNENCSNYLAQSDKIIHMINAFVQGIRNFDKKLNIPVDSINISTLRQKEGKIIVEFFARSMNENGLTRLKSEMNSLLNGFGFSVRFENETLSWQPEITEFANEVKEEASKVWEKVEFLAIHAGLECGVIAEKQQHYVEVCSIGPNIKAPHSIRECCEVASVERVAKIVDMLIRR